MLNLYKNTIKGLLEVLFLQNNNFHNYLIILSLFQARIFGSLTHGPSRPELHSKFPGILWSPACVGILHGWIVERMRMRRFAGVSQGGWPSLHADDFILHFNCPSTINNPDLPVNVSDESLPRTVRAIARPSGSAVFCEFNESSSSSSFINSKAMIFLWLILWVAIVDLLKPRFCSETVHAWTFRSTVSCSCSCCCCCCCDYYYYYY